MDGDGAGVAESPDSQTDAQMFVQLAMEKALSVYTRPGSHSGPGQPPAGIQNNVSQVERERQKK